MKKAQKRTQADWGGVPKSGGGGAVDWPRGFCLLPCGHQDKYSPSFSAF